ncbi:MAG: hypothetical protein WEA09_05535 [Gemmatimonadota bacterium]
MLSGLFALTLLASGGPEMGPVCLLSVDPPEYYAIALVPTRQVVGTGRAAGVANTTFGSSPFGVSLAADGSYNLTLHVQVDGLPQRNRGRFVAWATTPDIDEIVRVGTLDETGSVEGPVEWNKFLVVVTLEPEDDESPALDQWTGPIVLRGMSRSGMMHTMAGHGPFEQQECAAFGY